MLFEKEYYFLDIFNVELVCPLNSLANDWCRRKSSSPNFIERLIGLGSYWGEISHTKDYVS